MALQPVMPAIEYENGNPFDGAATMKALVYLGDGNKAFQDKPKPLIAAATDAIVRLSRRRSAEPTCTRSEEHTSELQSLV